MTEKLIVETTGCNLKVALETRRPKSWLKGVNAFASGIGGTLSFGIDNKGRITGIEDIQSDVEAISCFIKERITSLPQFVLTPVRKGDKDILLLSIAAGRITPYYHRADGIMEVHICVGNESAVAPDYVANESTLRGSDHSFDTLLTDAHKEDYDLTFLETTYRKRTGVRLEISDYFSFGLINREGVLTNAGKLLAGQYIVYNSRVFCTRWNGSGKGSIFDDALDDKEYEGNLIYLLQGSCDFVRNNSKVRFVKEARYRIDKPDHTDRAVMEAFVSALTHRDYIVTGSEVYVDMYGDRLEIQSPDGMLKGRPIQEYGIDSIGSVRRSPVIVDLFHRTKYMERCGSGLKKVLSETRKLPGYTEQLKPEFLSTPSDFRAVLRNINYSMEEDTIQDTIQDIIQDTIQDKNKRMKEIIAYCKEARTREEIQSYIGIVNRAHFRRAYLKPLLKTGAFEVTLPEKPSSRN